MACNCTADLRADIIKRFFGVEARRTEFAQELIRIVECQQTMMSRDLQEWFRIWFRFSDVMFEEFLACVMKRQTTMSKELQQVIRSRYFPTSQQMANDFIRVVLCSCCPTMCGTDVNIIGISDSFTVDGWYLQVDASNLVYMESGVVTQTVPCSSGIADYGHTDGVSGGFENPHYFSGVWESLLEVVIKDPVGTAYDFFLYGLDSYPWGAATSEVQVSTDNGATWNTAISGGAPSSAGITGTYDTGTINFVYRAVVTLEDGCVFTDPVSGFLCSPIDEIYFAFVVPSAIDVGGFAVIFATAVIPPNMTINLQKSLDGGTTWSDANLNVPAASFDGLTQITTGEPVGALFDVRLQLVNNTSGCTYYSDSAPVIV